MEIEKRVGAVVPITQILEWLHEEGVKVSKRTLEGRLNEWGVVSKHTECSGAPQTEQLVAAVGDPLAYYFYNDNVIAGMLNADGFKTTTNQVQKICRAHEARARREITYGFERLLRRSGKASHTGE